MMKRLLALTLLAFTYNLSAQCPPDGDLYASSQTDLEQQMALYPDCTVLHNLVLDVSEGSATPVTSLLPLHNITTVNGYVFLGEGCQLPTLAGLENLTWIENDFEIACTGLNDISALSNLTHIGGTLFFHFGQVQSLAPLNNLEYLGGFDYREAENATGEFGLQLNQSAFPGWITLWLTQDHDLSTLENLTTVAGPLFIRGPLTSLNGLQNLTSVGELLIEADISNINELSNLANVDWTLQLICPNVSSLEPLSSVTHAGGIAFANMPLVTSLHGLEGLTAIQGDASPYGPGAITLNNMDGLSGLGELANITSLHSGMIYLSGNDNLSDISALSNITTESISKVFIMDNPLLSVCSYENICTFLQGDGESEIGDNAQGCSTPAQIMAGCAMGIVGFDLQGITVYPNPAKDVLNISSPADIAGIVIYNSIGQVVLDSPGAAKVDISVLAPGLHICYIRNSAGTEQAVKFVVE